MGCVDIEGGSLAVPRRVLRLGKYIENLIGNGARVENSLRI